MKTDTKDTEQKELITIPQETPGEMVSYGKQSAKELITLVKQNDWAVNIQGKDYLQFEAWQTVGRFFGYTVKTVSTEYVEYGEAKGFEARVEVLDKDNNVIGGAEALCLDDERNWKGKPLYALKSMAQTRASGKALRMLLSWVVVLAGYTPTPAEEMDESFVSKNRSTPRRTSESGEMMITEAQLKLMNKLREQGKHEYSAKEVSQWSMDEASKKIKEIING